jgi:carboxyl-terminal processing protease
MIRSLAALMLFGCSALADMPADPEVDAKARGSIASMVTSLIATYHYDGRKPDDTIAVLWMDNYLKSLDYNRMFFLASDVAEFRRLAPTLDDDLRSGRPTLAAATTIHERYQQRVRERVADATAILEGPIDLTDDETYRFDRSEADWPADRAAAKELWRKRIEEQFILGAQAKRAEDDTRDLLRKRYHRLESDALTAEPMDVLERYLSALTTVYDPHTVYFKPATQDNFDIEMQNSLEGIGASLRTVGEYTVVMGLIAGGPAEKGGELQVNDKIIAVAQGDDEPVDVIDLRIDKVVKQIRGKKGSEVRLTVIPADATDPSETRIVAITRDKVVLADSDADFEVHEVKGKRIAVIDIPSFYVDATGKRSAARDLERILRKDMGSGIDAVALDLRNNGGGSLQEAVSMTGLFIDRGPVVQIRDGDGELETLEDTDGGVAWDGPLVVLTSPLSASASEIVAGAVQDYGRGLVVGSKTTHGKGSVQTVVGLSEMMARMSRGTPPRAGALKLTTQKFYRVNGESTQVRGVEADVVLPSPWDGLEIYEGDLDHALPWDEIRPTAYTKVGDLSPLLPALQAKSQARVASNDAFDEIRESIAERKRLQKDKTVSLNLEKRMADLAKTKTPAEMADDVAQEKADGDAPDPVLDEALAVLLDFMG